MNTRFVLSVDFCGDVMEFGVIDLDCCSLITIINDVMEFFYKRHKFPEAD